MKRSARKPKGRAPTPLQLCFPELVVEKEPDGTWNTPVRKMGDLDTTLSFTSPKTSQSGWHPWVECIDDMVDTTNSGIHASADLRLDKIRVSGVGDTISIEVCDHNVVGIGWRWRKQ